MSAKRGVRLVPLWNTDYLLINRSRKKYEICVYQLILHLNYVIFIVLAWIFFKYIKTDR